MQIAASRAATLDLKQKSCFASMRSRGIESTHASRRKRYKRDSTHRKGMPSKTKRTRHSKTTCEHKCDPQNNDVSLTTSAEEAKRWQEHGQKVSTQLLRMINIRIKEFERAVSDRLRDSITEESRAELLKDQKSLVWWQGALDKLTTLEPQNSLRDAMQVIYLESSIDGMSYAENVEEGEKQLAELRTSWEKKKRELEKIERKMEGIKSWINVHNERFKRRVTRHFNERNLKKFDDKQQE